MENLIEILEKFEKNREEWKNNKKKNWDENAVAECFKPCAEEILCNGYFFVNNKYIIDLGAIELYYHEEEGDIKDYIMYHINDNPKNKSKVKIKENGVLPYFKMGRFHFHQSGIDVTFENGEEGKKYRAAFLIRSYRVLEADNGKYPENNGTKYDPHSTHIFDDMFYGGVSLGESMGNEIKWEPFKKREKNDIELIARVNVPIVYMTDDGKIEKKESVDSKSEVETFKSGGKTYVKDTREWQFKLKNISEEK
ncbi:MAG: hypothetical protein VZQ98_12545 [Bacteroidales bacterium]|nr:hypothetical protein [Bacteroidales bacterium]